MAVISVKARDILPGDRVWQSIGEGWFGPTVKSVEVAEYHAHPTEVVIRTMNGGVASIGDPDGLKTVERF